MRIRSNTIPGLALVTLTAIGAMLPGASARAQPAQQQYVVVYGEFKPDPRSIAQGKETLEFLTRLARQSSGMISFASYTEIQRPNRFSLIEVWQDNASFTAFQNASNTQKTLQNLQSYLIAPLDERDGNLVE
jgi:quinol monooxygenase YgiN